MNRLTIGLLVALGVVTVVFTILWTLALLKDPESRRPTALELAIGFVTDFFDTLGIGSFAPTTAILKLLKITPDENIPGALNVGHAIPTFAEAFIFMSIVKIDGATLALMILASVGGAWLGAGVVTSWPRRRIQLGMAAALLCAAAFFLMKNLGLFPPGGDALALSGGKLAIGLAVNFVLGALMTLGIGAYAPCMILVSLLGMSPAAAFPIMMGSCAFLMPTAAVEFVRKRRYGPGPSLGLTLGGVPGVLLAAYVFSKLSVTALRWGVIAVVLYTAVMMLRSASEKA